MEWWVFQPDDSITVLELANLISKLKRIPALENLLTVTDKIYDAMTPQYRRHFTLYRPYGTYQEYILPRGVPDEILQGWDNR